MALALRVRRIGSDGDVQFGAGAQNYAEGSEATAQRCRTTPRLVQGEWPYDWLAGCPWFQPEDPNSDSNTGATPILGAAGGPNIPYAEAVLKALILGINGIASINSFSSDFDHVARHLSSSTNVTDIDGNTFDVAFQDPGP